ncbi:hypothetical protein GCG54_00010340 [Colletotrichum gloeosporioides]|uniref:Uncharacterized protein n=1 Tax=Colletotrichum gloeosporioides TaxID=474922 RepID=A0A8H4CW16_COLGL|nr:uncharacterized protein GCG54_00010340 [Colletotrichum gloeosporioides]KAF3811004.1 hypothetical protein GCG54_00010340 [Colletotrichum gloeosporioides]
MITYFWLFLVTFSVTIFFNRNHTGLKWSPCTLAAQVSLIQSSNILDELANIPTDSLNDAVRSWPKKGLRLHLGYWKKENSNLVIYGVRFLQTNDTHTTSDLDPERGIRNFDTRVPYNTY